MVKGGGGNAIIEVIVSNSCDYLTCSDYIICLSSGVVIPFCFRYTFYMHMYMWNYC